MNQKIAGLFILCIVTTIITASVLVMSGDDFEGYEKEWKKVEKFEADGLPESALKILENILANARTDKNENQLVKALIYKAKFIAQTEEDGHVLAIQILETEIAAATFPLKNILSSLTAELYQNYYQQNRWQIFERSNTAAVTGTDIRHWDLKTLTEHTQYLYKQSLANEAQLQEVPVVQYEYILQTGDKESRLLRPTLYDLLAHRAFDYFANDETYLSQPTYAFALDKEIYFADNKAFADIQITSKDTTSNKLYALDILRTLLRFHLKDPEPSALIDADLKRLQFIWQNATVTHKDSLYINALIQAQKKYAKHPASTRYSFALAQQYFNQSQQYDPFNYTATQFDAVAALAICDSATQYFPGSMGADNCIILKNQILAKSLSVQVEKYNIPNEPFRALVNWKNTQQLHLKIIQLNTKQFAAFNTTNYDNKLKFLAKQKAVTQWVQNLPDPADYQQHSAEIKIDGLPNGIYVLMASANKNFSESDAGVSLAVFQNTQITYISTTQQQGGNVFYVLHRNTGMPLANAEIQTYRQEYDNKTKKYVIREFQKYTCDANGIFIIEKQEGANNYLDIEVRYKGDTLLPDQNVYINSAEMPNSYTSTQTYFFTDRSIYRPGQTIFFKGITVEKSADGKSMRIVPNRITNVQLFDVNYQQVSTLQLTTNAFGSFSGIFIAPTGGLTGELMIQNESGSQYFSVEEYKRPTFKVETKAITGNYALGDTITIEGNAQSYSGANMDQAMVQYRVIRETVFPWHYFNYKFIYPRSTSMEITNGVTTTDAQGNFIIQFAAIPDKTVSPENRPQFNYRIIADVTDISGETRSNISNVNVGYISMNAEMIVPENIQKDSTLAIQITTTNLNNVPVSAQGTVTIYPLTAPGKLFRNRLWSQPDLYTITKEEYYTLFPNDVYGDENNMQKWAFGKFVQRVEFNTEASTSLQLNTQQWATGAYKIVLTTRDKNGEEIKVEKYFTVTDRKKKEIIPQYLSSPQSTFNAEPGKNININLNSAVDDARILLAISRPGKTTYEWFKLKDKINVFTIPVIETDRGGITATAYLISDNRLHEINWQIQVPWTNKQLKVELETHRNKLEPGENETWKIKISGPEGEKVAAELLASMYDKSLDAFKTHGWSFINWPEHRNNAWINAYSMFSLAQQMHFGDNENYYTGYRDFIYDNFNWFGFYFGYWGRGDGMYLMEVAVVDDSGKNKKRKADKGAAPPMESEDDFKEEVQVNLIPDLDNNATIDNVPLRSNFNETAFFYPHLETDSTGTIIFSFTIPESLTDWKFTALAHTKELLHGFTYSSVVTQKELMITPNMPRFLREGDTMSIAAKIQNLNDSTVTGTAKLEIFDAFTMQNVDALFNNTMKQVSFTAKGKQSASAQWNIIVPEGLQAITYRVKASAGTFSDGEENAIPVLTNRMLVTESLPLWVRAGKSKNFTFDKLLSSANSKTLTHQSVAVEYTSNPAWYAVQALPYMMEYPYECAEQIFTRYYANNIASFIIRSKPEIKRIFEQWKNNEISMLSNLEKNQELKYVMLEETPWVLQAQNESERKKRIALLFDINTMQMEMHAAINKLQKMQLPNGAFPWFAGMPESRYITQHIVSGAGHLTHLGVTETDNKVLFEISNKALAYLDDVMLEDYIELNKSKSDKSTYVPPQIFVHYLYGRSFYTDIPFPSPAHAQAAAYFQGQIKKYWLDYDLYSKGMIALIMHRADEKTTAQKIVASLKEFAIEKEEMGMYWKENAGGYYWYQAPIETQSLMIEVFHEISADEKAVEELKIWLLRNKQTNDWKTTKATANACYALLLTGNDLLESTELAEITIGGLQVTPSNAEAGTGYIKNTWSGKEVNETMGNISITGPQNTFSYGAMYWQYFEDLDKITPAATPLKLTKELYKQINTDWGIQIQEVNTNTPLKIGDIVTVRIELQVDRDMEYIHMKDMRASCFEPVNVLSQYKWQDGLGYYESTRDASTNFFIGWLPRGAYVFEYRLRVVQKGNFSNGITTIQCMYAPEFTSHSKGIRVSVL